MFGGIEFIEANNSYICGDAEFRTRDGNQYKIGFSPDGTWIQKMNEETGEYEDLSCPRGEETKFLVSLLPTDVGITWTWPLFLIAMTFWDEGHRARR